MFKAKDISNGKCTIYRYDCIDNTIPLELQYLIALAEQQRDAFSVIFPWEKYSCGPTTISYVAINPDTQIICGWLKASINQEEKKIYISALTSRSVTDLKYRGIGSSLISTLISDFSDFDFIYLTPTNKARDFYLRLGFRDYGSKNYLFKTINKEITSDTIRDISANKDILVIIIDELQLLDMDDQVDKL